MTPQQKESFELFVQDTFINKRNVRFGTIPDDPYLEKWKALGHPHVIVEEITDGTAIVLRDSAHGYAYLYDGEKWDWSDGEMAAVCGDYVFLGDYYGFPEGKLFKAVKTTSTKI